MITTRTTRTTSLTARQGITQESAVRDLLMALGEPRSLSTQGFGNGYGASHYRDPARTTLPDGAEALIRTENDARAQGHVLRKTWTGEILLIVDGVTLARCYHRSSNLEHKVIVRSLEEFHNLFA